MAISNYSNTCKVRLLLILNIGLSTSAWGLNSDMNQAATIISDSVEYNHQLGESTYDGHIHAIQGSTELQADHLTIFRNKNKKIDKIVALGDHAQYETLPDGQKHKVYAKANTIEYYPLEKKLVLLGKAHVLFEKNEIHGEHIIFNIDTQILSSLPEHHSKTTIVLHPSKEQFK